MGCEEGARCLQAVLFSPRAQVQWFCGFFRCQGWAGM